MGKLFTLVCDEHNCMNEYGNWFDDDTILRDLARDDGWRVEEDHVSCPSCFQSLYGASDMPIKPQGHRCMRCGRTIFMAIFNGKQSYWNATPANRGNQILYSRSHPQRIVMDKKNYYKVDDPKPRTPVFTPHRCRQSDVRAWQEERRAASIAAENKTVQTTTSSNSSTTQTWWYTSTTSHLQPRQLTGSANP